MVAGTKKRRPREILVEEIGRLRRRLDATRNLSSTLDLVSLTEIILQTIRREVPVERVTAFSVDRTSRTLRSVVAQGVEDFVIRLPIGVGIAGTVAQTGEILDIPHAYDDPRFYPGIDRLVDYHTHDIFCMPIFSSDKEVVGVLELLNRSRPITDSDKTFLNDIAGHVGLALELAWSHRDVLEQRKREEQLKNRREELAELDRVAIMGELVTSVMHELNNPLTILVGNVDLLKNQLKDSDTKPETHRYFEKIEMAADRSAATLRKFYNFVELPPRLRQPVDPSELLKQALALRENDWTRSGIQIVDELRGVPVIMANPLEIQYVFQTVLKNAEEAVADTGSNARITLRCSYDSASERIRIDIADNGPGIPAESQSRVFEPLFTLKPKGTGTGLGLLIARRIVEDHGGKIWLRTKQGTGTTVSIELRRGHVPPA